MRACEKVITYIADDGFEIKSGFSQGKSTGRAAKFSIPEHLMSIPL